MVVDNFDIQRRAVAPFEADSTLIVDPDAVLTGTPSFQGLEPIAWDLPQVSQLLRGIEHFQLSSRHPVNGPETPARLVVEQPLGILVAKAPDHAAIIMPFDYRDNAFCDPEFAFRIAVIKIYNIRRARAAWLPERRCRAGFHPTGRLGLPALCWPGE